MLNGGFPRGSPLDKLHSFPETETCFRYECVLALPLPPIQGTAPNTLPSDQTVKPLNTEFSKDFQKETE